MQIVIASGKGGTGKTTVTVNLASVSPTNVTVLDCDVEEPNAHLFIHPEFSEKKRVPVLYPDFDMELCTGCGDCKRACRFNAIAIIKDKPILVPELCHSCGACVTACSFDAISEVPFDIGTLESGKWKNGAFAHGLLDIGQARSEPLIDAVRDYGRARSADGLVLVDAPPGTSCPVLASVNGADYVVLVTEPTPFGLHDLRLAVEMCHALKLECGIVINRSDIGDNGVRDYCNSEGIKILAEFPFDRRVAETYSRGDIIVDRLPDLRAAYENLLERIIAEVNK